MRHGRAKAARKTLQFFERTQGIRPPYHILLDGTFVFSSVKLPLLERLDKLLQHAPVHLLMTQSSLDELENLRENVTDAEKKKLLGEAMQWAKQNCERILREKDFPKDAQVDAAFANDSKEKKNSISAAGRDIGRWATATAEHHPKYFVASQDEELLDVLRSTGSVPIIRLARGSVLLLEHPSKIAAQQDTREERQKWTSGVSEQERKLVQTVRQEEKKRKRDNSTGPAVRQKRRAKGPNPLSCKKKKDDKPEGGSKRKRRRKKTSEGETGDDIE
jgi:U3 small nucleolar RNA-associated protein 23